MPKSKIRKEKKRRLKKLPSLLPNAKEKPLFRKIADNLVATFLALVTLAGLVVFWPRLTVEPGGQTDPSNPHPIVFTITNTGIIPLENVQPALGLCELSFGEPRNPIDRCVSPLGTKLVFVPWAVKKLSMDEKHQIRLDDFLGGAPGAKFGAADISIAVSYNPWFFPIRREKEFRFVTRVENDGKLSWIPRPLEK